MGQAAIKLQMTADEFLAWDSTQSLKHEFVRGEVFAMAGGEDGHATAALNLAVVVRSHIAGTPCRVFMNDVKLRVDAADAFYYPDVMVTCSAADAASRLVKREPPFIAEVLSPSTASFDKGDKFEDYRSLPTLREYLLVNTHKRRCDLHRKGDDGLWVLHPFERGQAVTLKSLELTIPAEALWEMMPPEPA